MSFSKPELFKYERIVKDYVESIRPPSTLRNIIDISFEILGQSFEVFEYGPSRANPKQVFKSPIFKITFAKKSNSWKIYKQQSDQNLYLCESKSQVKTLEEAILILQSDKSYSTSNKQLNR
jgi:hypothetical protein